MHLVAQLYLRVVVFRGIAHVVDKRTEVDHPDADCSDVAAIRLG